MTAAAHRTITATLAVLCLALTAALILNRRTSRSVQPPEVRTVTDTLIIRDTVHIVRPQPAATGTVGTVSIPVPVPPDRHNGTVSTDTLRITDTVYIRLPIEQRYYTGLHYEVWVSGYRPRLDSLRIRTEALRLTTATTITQPETIAPLPKPKRWGIGIHLGYGLTIASKPEFHPYIGIGISYNILTF